MLRLRLVVGKVVPSLGSGGGNTLTRGLNEVRRKVNGGTLRNTYIHTWRRCFCHSETFWDISMISELSYVVLLIGSVAVSSKVTFVPFEGEKIIGNLFFDGRIEFMASGFGWWCNVAHPQGYLAHAHHRIGK